MKKFLIFSIFYVLVIAAFAQVQSQITYRNGKAQFIINGKEYEPLLYNYPYKWPMEKEAFRRQLEMFKNADIHLYTVCFQLHEFVEYPDGSVKQCFAPGNEVALFEYRAVAVDEVADSTFGQHKLSPV